MKEWRLKNIHGLSVEIVEGLLLQQDYKCAICGYDIKDNFQIDHDHSCCATDTRNGNVKRCGNCVRALLCGSCNAGLGFFKDDTNLLMLAISYIEKFKSTEL